MMHEFGHALGLNDLYPDQYGGRYAGYLMGPYKVVEEIPPQDIEYLRQAYSNLHGAIPH